MRTSEFGESETISNTVRALLAVPSAVVAVDLPLKDVVRKPRKTLLERISVAASRVNTSAMIGITGQFFCARASALRDVWMPKGMPVEETDFWWDDRHGLFSFASRRNEDHSGTERRAITTRPSPRYGPSFVTNCGWWSAPP